MSFQSDSLNMVSLYTLQFVKHCLASTSYIENEIKWERQHTLFLKFTKSTLCQLNIN